MDRNARAYGVGYIGQGAAYGFMSAYMVVYLTKGVGLSSSLASTISSLALLVEVVMGVLVGNLSDGCTSRLGRRIPFMFAASLTMIPIFFFFFHTIGPESGRLLRFAYYLLFAMLFRVFFSCFEIPNQALGAEIVRDYDGRTRLRTATRYFSILGNGIGYILPLLVLQLYGERVRGGWQTTGLLIGCITAAAWFASSVINRGHGTVLDPAERPERSEGNRLKDIAKNYSELFGLRAARLLVAYKAAFTCSYALYNVAMVFYLQYSVGLDNKYTSYMYVITIAVFLVMTPLVNRMALRAGKVNEQLVSMLVCGAAGIAIYFTAPASKWGAALYIACFSVMQTGFWQLSSAIFYDVIEVDEWVHFKRREGDIMSLVSVLGTLISAIMVWLFGFGNDIAGFDSQLAAQPESVAHFLNLSFMLLPSVFLLLGALALKLFPINKKTFESLCLALEARRKGENYEEYLGDVNRILGRK